jgi:hypothetical protein
MPKAKKCAMCGNPFKEKLIPTDLSMRMPYIKGEARLEFSLKFSAKINVCDLCTEPIMEGALRAIRNKCCPHMIEMSIHTDLLDLKLARPKSKKAKK